MNSKEYIEKALRTESRDNETSIIDGDLVAFLKSMVCLTEIIDCYKKHIFYGVELDAMKIMEETHKMEFIYDSVNRDEEFEVNKRVLHGIIGLATESGELVEALIKFAETGEMDRTNILEELGDQQWYDAILFDELDSDWGVVQEKNIAKLSARYPDKFTTENAVNRNLDKEREILES